MDFSDREIEVARRCLEGDLNETQVNYIITTEKMDRERIDGLMDNLAYSVPMASAAKFIILYIIFNFVFCIFFSLLQIWRN